MRKIPITISEMLTLFMVWRPRPPSPDQPKPAKTPKKEPPKEEPKKAKKTKKKEGD